MVTQVNKTIIKIPEKRCFCTLFIEIRIKNFIQKYKINNLFKSKKHKKIPILITEILNFYYFCKLKNTH
ncbi:hypothetical protein CCAND38_100046 [Capnocytophaga canis]|uniref:Uncharacterized protein n=1 Tax=Capnocytophaga canis TaxID=1848903 RepID=A0A0B7I0V5_9FLAO|nr:hypothetical protein CCAND38_100046 [Capnocytophaga canis]